jgi:HSP20 family protein
MSHVAVQKISPDEASLLTDVQSLTDRIRLKAYELFQNRGGRDGSALDDWLTAEDDLVLSPESDLVETDGKFEMQIAVPGFEANDINVSALPDALIVRAENAHHHEGTEGDVRFCEFGEKSLFRRFDLPAPIDVDKVTTSLQKGILKVTAAKEEKTALKSSSVAA